MTEAEAVSRSVLLEAEGVSWSVDRQQILAPVSLTLAAGECVAVVGPNGAGKTTLLRLLSGILEPTSGERRWRGTPYGRIGRRQLARHIAYVPQIRPARIPLTVEQLVLLGRYPYLSVWQMSPSAEDRAVARGVLKRVGLERLASRPIEELSGGERQAVFIAAALCQQSDVLLLDEPTTHLDPRHRQEVARLLLDLRAGGRHAIVLTTHDLDLASRLADRVVALGRGHVLADGPAAEVLAAEHLEEVFGVPFDVVVGDGGRYLLPRLEP